MWPVALVPFMPLLKRLRRPWLKEPRQILVVQVIASLEGEGVTQMAKVLAQEIQGLLRPQVLRVQALPAIPTRVSETDLAVLPLWLPERLAN